MSTLTGLQTTGPRPTYEQRIAWFHQARFGLFVHWGLYSLLERGEWVFFRERVPLAEYEQLADRFLGEAFDVAVGFPSSHVLIAAA